MIKKIKAEKQPAQPETQVASPVPDPPGGALSFDPADGEPMQPVDPVDPLDALEELRALPEKERILALVTRVWETRPELSFGQLIDHIFLCRPAGMGQLMGFLSDADFILILERILATPPLVSVPASRQVVTRKAGYQPDTDEAIDPDVTDRFAATTGRMPLAQF